MYYLKTGGLIEINSGIDKKTKKTFANWLFFHNLCHLN